MRVSLFILCGVRVRISGKKYLNQIKQSKKPVIYFSKHQSAWETYIFPGILPKHAYVLKESLIKIPVYGWGLRALKAIPINRDEGLKALKKVIKLGLDRVNKKWSVLIFPEGTRVPYGESPEFHKSGALLAQKIGCDIVPIAHNSGKCFDRKGWKVWPGIIDLVIGEPVSIDNKSVDELNTELYQWMTSTVNALNAQPAQPAV